MENCPNVTLSLRHQSAVVLTHFLIAGTQRSDVPVLWIKMWLSRDEIDIFSRCAKMMYEEAGSTLRRHDGSGRNVNITTDVG